MRAGLAHCAGVDFKTVPAQLGHSNIVLTADTYTSVLTDLLAYAAEATARLVLAAAARKPGPPAPPQRTLGEIRWVSRDRSLMTARDQAVRSP